MKYADWRVSKLSPYVLGLDFNLTKEQKTGGVFLSSDHHTDNALCDHGALRADLKAATDANIPIVSAGDTFCAMQGRWDPRADQNQLLPELRGNKYLNNLVDFHEDFYSPYKSHLVDFSYGNHEGGVIKRHQTDLLQHLESRLKKSGGSLPFVMPFQHFIRVQLTYAGKQASRLICIHHGYGGGGEVTRGMIDHSRTRSQYFADVFYSGHIHRANADENEIVTVSKTGERVTRKQLFLRGAAYVDDLQSDWQIGRGMAARPKGGWFVFFTLTPYVKDGVQKLDVGIDYRRSL